MGQLYDRACNGIVAICTLFGIIGNPFERNAEGSKSMIWTAPWWAIALIAVAGALALSNWFFRRPPAPTIQISDRLKPLIEAFEMHATREFFLSGACGPQNSTAGQLLSTDDRDFLRQKLRELDKACEPLGLPATRSAIADAIGHFDQSSIDAGTAYAQFRGVSLALKGELGRSGTVVSSSGAVYPVSRRWLAIGGAVVVVVVALLAADRLIDRLSPRQEWGASVLQSSELDRVLSLPLIKFQIFLAPLSSDTGAMEIAEQLAGRFRSKGWQAVFVNPNFVTANNRGIAVVYSENWTEAEPPQAAKELAQILESAGIKLSQPIRKEGTLTVLEKQNGLSGTVGIVIGKAP